MSNKTCSICPNRKQKGKHHVIIKTGKGTTMINLRSCWEHSDDLHSVVKDAVMKWLNRIDEKSFNRILNKVKRKRKRTNIDEWKNALDFVIKEMEWEIIKNARMDRCFTCGKRLPDKVAEWALKKDTIWFCEEHYREELAANNKHVLELNGSFLYMLRKNGGSVIA